MREEEEEKDEEEEEEEEEKRAARGGDGFHLFQCMTLGVKLMKYISKCVLQKNYREQCLHLLGFAQLNYRTVEQFCNDTDVE